MGLFLIEIAMNLIPESPIYNKSVSAYVMFAENQLNEPTMTHISDRDMR